MYIKIVTDEYKDLYGKTNFEIGKKYYADDYMQIFHFIKKEQVFGAYREYFAPRTLEQVRFLEIKPLDSNFESDNLYYERSGSRGIEVLREVPLEEVMSEKKIREINEYFNVNNETIKEKEKKGLYKRIRLIMNRNNER